MTAPISLPKPIPVVSLCIAHTDPQIPPSGATVLLEIGPSGTLDPARYPHIVNCYDKVPYGETYRKELGSTLGSFAAMHHLQDQYDTLDFAVNLSTYRTFMLADKRQAQFHEILKLNFITQAEARALGELALPREVHTMWRLPMPIRVSSLAGNYEKCHHIEDLDLYLEVAVAEGVLTAEDVAECRARPILLPGALSVGMMPADVFCDLNEKLERVTRAFLPRFSPDGRDSYQIRAANFCHERLGSYLLEQHLYQSFGRLPETHFGYWTRVDEDLSYSRGHM